MGRSDGAAASLPDGRVVILGCRTPEPQNARTPEPQNRVFLNLKSTRIQCDDPTLATMRMSMRRFTRPQITSGASKKSSRCSRISSVKRLLWTLGSILVLGGLGHFIGISRLYMTQGVPDANRVLLDIWIGEAQIIGGGLYLAASRAIRSGARWQSMGTAGAVTIIGYTAPILPVLFVRAPVLSRVPAAVYLAFSLWILTIAIRPAARH